MSVECFVPADLKMSGGLGRTAGMQPLANATGITTGEPEALSLAPFPESLHALPYAQLPSNTVPLRLPAALAYCVTVHMCHRAVRLQHAMVEAGGRHGAPWLPVRMVCTLRGWLGELPRT